ncbi:311R [Invertebrate iridescent virus Kaz2018]|uniref:311R n=1 Tax=Invertebrate iridescent virus 6 TaxID=176652 RepID=Q91FL3_IIV6|nr:311R [Invertebrate iridescent virus 6]AAK82172.1 311R [Invertebrate iridescent virus 6]QMS79754.1 hypothetical protein IIV6-T1_305 [Invertebrate iridescent virus 6]QNH08721.1 311R [Invertebrate iridescent virus Kaz2018]
MLLYFQNHQKLMGEHPILVCLPTQVWVSKWNHLLHIRLEF